MNRGLNETATISLHQHPALDAASAAAAACTRCGGLLDVVFVNNVTRQLDGGVACACGNYDDDISEQTTSKIAGWSERYRTRMSQMGAYRFLTKTYASSQFMYSTIGLSQLVCSNSSQILAYCVCSMTYRNPVASKPIGIIVNGVKGWRLIHNSCLFIWVSIVQC